MNFDAPVKVGDISRGGCFVLLLATDARGIRVRYHAVLGKYTPLKFLAGAWKEANLANAAETPHGSFGLYAPDYGGLLHGEATPAHLGWACMMPNRMVPDTSPVEVEVFPTAPALQERHPFVEACALAARSSFHWLKLHFLSVVQWTLFREFLPVCLAVFTMFIFFLLAKFFGWGF